MCFPKGLIQDFLLGRGKNQSCEAHCSCEGVAVLPHEIFKLQAL